MAIYVPIVMYPEAVYCCFTRTTLLTKLFTCLYDQSLKLLSHHQGLLLFTLDRPTRAIPIYKGDIAPL